MASFFRPHVAARVERHAPRTGHRLHLVLAPIAALLGLAFVVVSAPPAPATDAELIAAYNDRWGQSLTVPATVETPEIVRDSYDATPGIETLKASGTNYDWATMVLLFADFPVTEDSVTVITRWMRQENYVDNWWLRNNPLNNGWGAEGGTFLGGNPDLVDAAQDVANALTTYAGYAGMRAAFERGAPAAEIENEIWFGPWATGHYNDGAHWSYVEVPVITAPASAWG
ncbi:hypothetical protein [uncultured Schumannella sp.]|uniref:hypothetical protein n=1 Tax=uncultured Schumannella sp. TaxID=1195956 RepID=UPI0025D17F0F|nr:hypothetical protein [uncultured Schumannella sp.]